MLRINNKEHILKGIKQKCQVAYKSKSFRIISDLSIETLKAKRVWTDVLLDLKQNKCQRRLLYLAKLSFKIEE
jgi:hypothetical protein